MLFSKVFSIGDLHKFVLPYQLTDDENVQTTDKLTDDAATAAAFMFYDKNYTAKKLLV